tara:strand:+ start:6729 stop:6947 length:219 start_codon:yes stop_codon:yes gene_type:complete
MITTFDEPDHPELPGWRIQVAIFDYGRFAGVAICKQGRPRFAARTFYQDGVEHNHLIEAALPALKKFAGDNS